MSKCNLNGMLPYPKALMMALKLGIRVNRVTFCPGHLPLDKILTWIGSRET